VQEIIIIILGVSHLNT